MANFNNGTNSTNDLGFRMLRLHEHTINQNRTIDNLLDENEELNGRIRELEAQVRVHTRDLAAEVARGRILQNRCQDLVSN